MDERGGTVPSSPLAQNTVLILGPQVSRILTEAYKLEVLDYFSGEVSYTEFPNMV